MTSRDDETRRPEAEPDVADTVLRPAAAPGPDPDPDDEQTVRRPRFSSGFAPEPDDEPTLLRPRSSGGFAPSPDPDEEPTVQRSAPVPAPAPEGFVDEVPLHRTPLPDDAPIQRFDQRPRFDLTPPPPPASPADAPQAGVPQFSAPAYAPGQTSYGPAWNTQDPAVSARTSAPEVSSTQSADPQSTYSPASAAVPAFGGNGAPAGAASAPAPAPSTPRPAGSPAPSAGSAPSSAGSTLSSAGSAATPPGVDATAGRRRRFLLPAVAFGCAVLLALGLGGGATMLWFAQRSEPAVEAEAPTSAPTGDSADPAAEESAAGQWQQLEAGQTPAGTPEELQQVLAENPLLEAQLPVPVPCEPPATEGGKVPDAELQAYLDIAADCLATTWGDALEPQGVTFEAPRVVVYTMDALPPGSACDHSSFSATSPRTCLEDNTLYWPAEWDPGFSNTSASETSGLYMWHLSYSYSVFALASASLDQYYAALLEGVADSRELSDEMRRRYSLQLSCLGSAAAFQMPTGARPTERVQDFLLSVDAQGVPQSAADPSQESRADWVIAGEQAGGDLSACNTWESAAGGVS